MKLPDKENFHCALLWEEEMNLPIQDVPPQSFLDGSFKALF